MCYSYNTIHSYKFVWHFVTASHQSLISLFHSEDYYGDLDLKSIRKSELLAGLQNTGEARAVAAKAAVSAAAAKPRPQPAKEA